jgi:NADPH-dependent ferric siderophore reductase
MTETVSRPRAARPQATLSVRASAWLTPGMVRLTVGGPGMSAFRTNDFTDKYAKILFVDPALGLTPPYDLAALQATGQAVTRTYTVRRVDLEAAELDIDFVVHGDEGIAAPWAAAARPGDTLTLSGAGGAYAPSPQDDRHLFLGDESALPAIGAALDALPDGARGVAYLEVEDEPAHLTAPPGVEVVLLRRRGPGTTPALLADTLAAAPWPGGRVGVFAHGERGSMKAVRAVLRQRDLGGGTLSLSGYWAYGRTEDRFQAEKRTPIGQIEP